MNLRFTITSLFVLFAFMVNGQAVQYTTTADGKMKFKETQH
jgi:hypothetical protein